MKVSNSKGLANHIGPESCAGGSNPLGEALTGERAGWVLSREIEVRTERRQRRKAWKATLPQAKARVCGGLCEVEDPKHARKHFVRESGEPVFAQREDGPLGCIGKSKDTSQ